MNVNVNKLCKTQVMVGAVIHPCNFPIAISLLSIARGDVAGVAFAEFGGMWDCWRIQ